MRLASLLLWLLSTTALGEPARADLHVHFAMQSALFFFQGESGHGRMAGSPSTLVLNQVDDAQLLRAGIRLAVASVWPPLTLRPGVSARDLALHQLEALQRFAARHPEVKLVHTAAEATAVLAAGRQIALIPAVEGGEGLASAEDADLYFARGARLITFMHLVDSPLGGSAESQLGHSMFDMETATRNPRGLTPLGQAVLKRLLELGIVVDIAHASDASAAEIMSTTEAARVPVVVTHTGARAFDPIERNLSDENALRVVRGGGVIGVSLGRRFLEDVPASAQWHGYAAGTCDDFVAHFLHLGHLVGAGAVMVGSDLNGMIVRSEAGGACGRGIRSTEDLPALYASLAAHGVPQAAIDGSAEAFIETWARVEAKAEPAARQRAMHARVPAYRPFDAPVP